MAKVKLVDLLREAFEDKPQVNKHEVVEGVRNYGIVGKSLYSNTNIMEIAKQLSTVAESAHNHILGEQDDWFDKVSVNKNMKSLKGSVVEFQKTAKEEALDKADPEKAEPEDDFEDREDKDIDNDGDSDDSDKYLHKKRQAISKAVKKEVKDALEQTREQLEKRPKKTLKDVTRSVYSSNSIGYFGNKKN